MLSRIRVPHYVTKRQQCQGYEFHVLCSDRETDDRQRKKEREDQVHYGEFKSGQNDPYDVHDQRYRTARRFGFLNLPTERGEDATGKSETHETERDADDREAQKNAAKNITQED